MGKTLQQALADEAARKKDKELRSLSAEEAARERLMPLTLRVGAALVHDQLNPIGLFGSVQHGIGYRYSLPSPKDGESVLIEVFEHHVRLKRGQCSVDVAESKLHDEGLVAAAAYMMSHVFIDRETILERLDEHQTKPEEANASL